MKASLDDVALVSPVTGSQSEIVPSRLVVLILNPRCVLGQKRRSFPGFLSKKNPFPPEDIPAMAEERRL